MSDSLLRRAPRVCVPLKLVTEQERETWIASRPAREARWLQGQGFKAAPGSFCVVPDEDGGPSYVAVGLSSPPSLWDCAGLPGKLPDGAYRLEWDGPVAYREWLALGWVLGTYAFSRYRKNATTYARLVLPQEADAAKIMRYADAIFMARDLINTTAQDMGPADLAEAVASVGKMYDAKVTKIVGDDLLKENYPAIHAVGRASSRAPRLVDLTWGNPRHPRVTLVGKGVCFDTGGLNLKTGSSMYLMKKDMGGAACALAVARMVMDAKLPVRLRLLIPAVENAVSGNAYHPSDVITMRNGLTVEVGDTDAEGRLILADALAEAAREKPEILIDFATLTGSARVAVGTELAALFCTDDAMASELTEHGQQMEDPFWRMPLYEPYDKLIDSKIADICSVSQTPYAGAITAALFLKRFAGGAMRWAHIDCMCWNLSSRPGRPEGAEAQAVRSVFRMIEERAGKESSRKP